MSSRPAPRRAFLGVSALLFAASASVTIAWCGSMSAMGGMVMPGGWTLSMAWMRMPGETWPGAAAAFLGMWIVMMVAMMLPCLVPMLGSYRRDLQSRVGTGTAPLRRLTAVMGLGYFAIWTAIGAVVFPLGVALAAVEVHWPPLARAVPLAAGGVVLVAGLVQLSPWKVRQLGCCHEAAKCDPTRSPSAGTAWRYGVSLGLRCGRCCGNLMAILLAVGVMDLRAMVLVTAALTAERLAPRGDRVARATGAVVVGAGLFLIARAARLG